MGIESEKSEKTEIFYFGKGYKSNPHLTFSPLINMKIY